MTPLTRLFYISGVLFFTVWAIVIIYFLPNPFGTVWLMGGCPLIGFYGYKYFFAYKHWLDSYTKLSQSVAFTFFSRALHFEQHIKSSPMMRGVVRRWLKYYQPRQERWNRAGNSFRVSKPWGQSWKELTQDHRPSVFTFPVGVTDSGETQVEPSRTPHLLGKVGSQLILSLHGPMAKTPH